VLRHSKKTPKIKAYVDSRKNPDVERRRREIPLDPATLATQRRLRAAVATQKALLADAEDKATLVNAKLVSRGKGRNVPTVEAVETTIRKLTTMVEKRSGDVDVLEMQLRNLGIKPRSFNTPVKGRTFALEEEEGGDRAQDRQEMTERLVDVTRRRFVVLAKIRDAVHKREAAPAVAA